ncbi:MAG: Hsp20/alpha crystallin family protein [Gemmatimonadetes bacterium]|uniref:Hsp20/alpha crystallin family protein n=1 Tax=Candidatus Kutchimonas denitrificans TaxID=3056748 RepID=A0AAE5CA66_9BACT|nr:Hsp20/alpha crystallin family protein [Gemmatimonadota bacterium]NIR76186.1 Hsp20/alpha crystallin family protein [Candidatus Kutchimonas denitrificans]NIS00626.1 Hsp20/alpha crystallin family protein [Gemmatimonadota bacterium]NIT66771.1 Hsp20/alpha crystallin family protein [Gemmatimonadota bacterium]NIV23370.1 Hsp20 family protein [Gemmatimonadota bacterium]
MNEKSSEKSSGRGALAELKEAVGNLVDSVVGMAPDFGIRPEWPRHELIVEDDGYRVQVELPGFSREAVDVSVAGRNLSVAGERKKFEPPAGARLLRSERPSGKFDLSIRLPADVDALGVVAQMREGILEIKLPKTRGRGRPIDIESVDEASGETEVRREPGTGGASPGQETPKADPGAGTGEEI